MDVKLPPIDKDRLRESFFELLQSFPTFPAATNFFLVKIENIPAALTDENQQKLGITNKPTNIDKAKQIYKNYIDGGTEYMYLVNGVDLTTESTSVTNAGRLINGYLPVGPFMDNREYPDTDLDIQFSETNISFVDTVIRPWIQMYSVHGNFGGPDSKKLTTNLDVYFLAKEQLTTRKTFKSVLFGTSGGKPVVRKIYKYRDCIPYNIVSANTGEYNGDSDIGSIGTRWRFSTYDVINPIDGEL